MQKIIIVDGLVGGATSNVQPTNETLGSTSRSSQSQQQQPQRQQQLRHDSGVWLRKGAQQRI